MIKPKGGKMQGDFRKGEEDELIFSAES